MGMGFVGFYRKEAKALSFLELVLRMVVLAE